MTPLGIRRLDPPELRRRIAVAYRSGGGIPAPDTLRALLRGAFSRPSPTP
ncbi:hypothetical protein [Streptomyces sp. NPDC059649]